MLCSFADLSIYSTFVSLTIKLKFKMKKLVITTFAVLSTLMLNAQDDKMAQPAKMDTKKEVVATNDYLVMKGGKIYFYQNGKITTPEKDVTLSDGSIVSSNGDIKGKDGNVRKMKEGDFLYMNGTLRSTAKTPKAE